MKIHENGALYESIINAETLLLQLPDGGSYDFRVFPFGERGQFLENGLIREIVICLENIVIENNIDFNAIVSPEPGGHIWGLLMAYQLNKDLYINRINAQKIENTFIRTTPYNSNYLKSIPAKAGSKVIILDDIISSGSTLISLLTDLKQNEVDVVAALAIYNKQTDMQMSNKLGIKVMSIIDDDKKTRYLNVCGN